MKIISLAVVLCFATLSAARAQTSTPPLAPQSDAPAQASAPTSSTSSSVLTATSPSAAAPQVSPDYIIGPGDSLGVNVWKEPTISGTFPVRPDGMISLALVGDIQASGLTPARLGSDVAERLRKYINEPSVTVAVLSVNSKHIFLLGEISKPGEMPLLPGLTPLQAIASAGGLTPFANGKRIYILRGTAGKQQKIPFNYKKAVKDGNLQGVTLAPGDTIVIP